MPKVLPRRTWIFLVLVVLGGAGVWVWQAGYAPQIGRFFASEYFVSLRDRIYLESPNGGEEWTADQPSGSVTFRVPPSLLNRRVRYTVFLQTVNPDGSSVRFQGWSATGDWVPLGNTIRQPLPPFAGVPVGYYTVGVEARDTVSGAELAYPGLSVLPVFVTKSITAPDITGRCLWNDGKPSVVLTFNTAGLSVPAPSADPRAVIPENSPAPRPPSPSPSPLVILRTAQVGDTVENHEIYFGTGPTYTDSLLTPGVRYQYFFSLAGSNLPLAPYTFGATVTKGGCGAEPYLPAPSQAPSPTPLSGIQMAQPQPGSRWSVPGVHDVTWTTPPDFRFSLSSPVELTLTKRDLGPDGIFKIGTSTLGEGIFNWDTSRPVSRVIDGAPQLLADIPGNDFFISMRISGEQEGAGTGDFSLATGGPMPTLTPTPNPNVPGLYIDPPAPGGGQISAGSDFTVPVLLETGPYSVTAVKVIAQLEGNAVFAGAGAGTPLFPEVLQQPVQSPNSVTFTVGSGPSGGQSGSRLQVGQLAIRVPLGARDGEVIRVQIIPGSEVSAVGYPGNVLRYGGANNFTVVSRPPVTGDANGDGKVDIFDYNIVISEFGQSGPPGGLRGDLNRDGTVDIFDYNIVITNFGS